MGTSFIGKFHRSLSALPPLRMETGKEQAGLPQNLYGSTSGDPSPVRDCTYLGSKYLSDELSKSANLDIFYIN